MGCNTCMDACRAWPAWRAWPPRCERLLAVWLSALPLHARCGRGRMLAMMSRGRLVKVQSHLAATQCGANGSEPAARQPPTTSMSNIWIQTEVKEGSYGFNAGQPGPPLIPIKEIKDALDRAMGKGGYDPLMLQYRTPKEFLPCRLGVATLLASMHGRHVAPEQIAITSGNSAALGMLFSNHKLRKQRGGSPPTAVVENPTYFLARDMLADAGVLSIACPIDREGLRVDVLEAMCAAGEAPDFVYTQPNYHNPTGYVLSRARRRKLVQLAAQYEFFVLADEPYNMLCFDEDNGGARPLPLCCEEGAEAHVLSLGSFSKILAPGLRIGWIQGQQELLERAFQSAGIIRSGGALNPLSALIVAELLRDGFLERHIRRLVAVLGDNLQSMVQAIKEHIPGATVDIPSGGYFVWIRLPASCRINAAELLARAQADAETPLTFTVGEACVAATRGVEAGEFDQYLRLSFAFHTAVEIQAGVALLGRFVCDASGPIAS